MKKSLKNGNGITLIALVITIIVLLILVGVTIATLTGDNGILTKANEAKDKTKEADEIERLQVEVAGSFGNDGQIDIAQLKKNLEKNIKEVSIYGKELPILITISENTYMLNENFEIKKVLSKDYYGKYVDYSVDVDGNNTNNDWQIYYSDGDNIYLISKNILLTQDINTNGLAEYLPSKTVNGTTYSINASSANTGRFTDVINAYPNGSAEIIDSNPAKKWLEKYYNAIEGEIVKKNAIKAMAYMMDTEIWKSKFIKTEVEEFQTEYMIGGVPLELFAKSYNITHNSENQKRLYIMSTREGYRYALEESKPNNLDSYTVGDFNKIFDSDIDSYFGVNRQYWLASLLDNYWGDSMCVAVNNFLYGYQPLNANSNWHFRSIVCLKSNVNIIGGSGTETDPYKLSTE